MKQVDLKNKKSYIFPMEKPLVVTNLCKRYGSINALNDVSFQINEGEVFGLLGPNGAGKTTTITSIVSLESPSSGKITVFGNDVQKNPLQAKRAIGYVPQELIHHGYFSVFRIMQFYGMFFGITGLKEQIEYLLKRLDLWNHRYKLVNQLSGGMKRRLLIAKALIHKPKLILLDEPTAGVDVELRQTLWDFIRELRKQGISILLTTHYLEEAEMLCDRIGILHQGSLEKIDSTQQLIEQLAQREVRISLQEKTVPITHKYLVSQSDVLLKFSIPSSYPLGQLLNQISLKSGIIKDIHIREGKLEDAFQSVIRGNE